MPQKRSRRHSISNGRSGGLQLGGTAKCCRQEDNIKQQAVDGEQQDPQNSDETTDGNECAADQAVRQPWRPAGRRTLGRGKAHIGVRTKVGTAGILMVPRVQGGKRAY